MFVCLGSFEPLPAATLLWVGGNGYWTNAANWTPAQVPGIGDVASITSGTVTLTGDVGVQTLNLNGGGLTGVGTFQGVLNWSGGGGAFDAVALTIAHGSQLNLVGNADKLLAIGVITNHGVLSWTGDGSFKFGFDQAYLRNEADGEVQIQSASFLGGNPLTDNDGAYIYNSGLLTCDVGSGTNTVAVGRGTFVNNGTVRVVSGSLVFTDGLVSTGTNNELYVADTSVLDVSGGLTRFTDTTFSGAGVHRLRLGTMTMTGGIQATNLVLAGATLQGQAAAGGQTLLRGILNWQSGVLSDLALTIVPGAELDLTGAGLMNGGDASLTNHGRMVWTGAGDFKGSFHLVNATDGEFLIQSTGYFGGAPTGDNYFTKLENNGLWICDVGLGESYESAGHYTFPNTGLIEVRSGTLLLDTPVNSSGPSNEWRVAAGATLALPGGNSDTFSNTVFSGPGLHRFYRVGNGTGPVTWNGDIHCTNVVVDGSLLASGSGTTTLHGLLQWNAGETSALAMTVAGDGEIDLTGPGERNLIYGSLTNQGRIVWRDSGNFRLNGASIFANETNGVFLVQSTGFLGGNPSIDNNDAFIFNRGTWISDTGGGTNVVSLGLRPFVNTGTIEVRSGVMQVFAPGGLGVPEGSVLRFDIGGTRLGTEFGQLQVAGPLALAGQFQVVLTNGFQPQSTDIFPILNATSSSGSFSTFLGAPAGGGLFFDPVYANVGVTLRLHDNRPDLEPLHVPAANGQYSLLLTGAISQPYDVVYSADLVAWTLLKTVIPSASSVIVTDDTIGTNTFRFYRVKIAAGP